MLRMKKQSGSSLAELKSILRDKGARITSARIRVLGLLQSAHAPLSHGDIEGQLSKDAYPEMDRVTLYRVLDWLTDIGLVHKAADSRGVFCFTAANPNVEHARHMHFRCTDCGSVFCLDMPPPSPPKLPKGFRLAGMELDIRGNCPNCVRKHPRSDRRSQRPIESR